MQFAGFGKGRVIINLLLIYYSNNANYYLRFTKLHCILNKGNRKLLLKLFLTIILNEIIHIFDFRLIMVIITIFIEMLQQYRDSTRGDWYEKT